MTSLRKCRGWGAVHSSDTIFYERGYGSRDGGGRYSYETSCGQNYYVRKYFGYSDALNVDICATMVRLI